MDLEDAVMVVTGASSGIGAATARLAASHGAQVVLAARRTDRIEALAAELPGAMAITTDLRNPADVGRLVHSTLGRHGRIDVLVNNAGQGLYLPLEQVTLADFVAITELNVYAPLLAMQAVLPAMRLHGRGTIVNISSLTSRIVLPGVGAYAATKSALDMLSQVARAELAPEGILVSLVYPFITATEFHQAVRAGQLVWDGAGGPIQPHTAEHVADAVVRVVRSGEEETFLVPGQGN